jgi:aspartate kinase
VAIASSLKAVRCDIYTDVEGVYTADPNVEKNAKKINKVSYEEMLEMSSMGAKVLQTRSVELAMKNNLTLQVLSSLTNIEGTYIVNENKLIEKEIVSGVSYSKNESKITISGIPDKPGISAKIFGLMASNNINVDMIVQNISQDGVSANMTFTVLTKDIELAKKTLERNNNELNYTNLSTDSNIAKISVIGMGMMSQSGVAEKMFKTLADKQINILAISTSEIKISVLIDKKYTDLAVKTLHSVYKLDNK